MRRLVALGLIAACACSVDVVGLLRDESDAGISTPPAHQDATVDGGDVDASPTDAVLDAGAFLGAYELFAKSPASTTYVGKKYAYALRHVEVKVEGPPEKGDANITATVTYRFPFNVPLIGRILGKRGDDGTFHKELTSSATIPNEGPRGDLKNIGIHYGTLE